MRHFQKISFILAMLSLSPGFAVAAEKYAATVNDGTAESIRANTVIDDNGEYLSTPAPKKLKARFAEPNRIARPEKKVADLEARVKQLEQAKAERDAELDRGLEKPTTVSGIAKDSQQPAVEVGIKVNAPAAAKAQTAQTSTPATPVTEVQTSATEVTQGTIPATGVAVAAPTAQSETAKKARPEPQFDVVPRQRVLELATRLKYANDILRRFGRAYDYRTTTLKQFKAALAQLEKEAASESKN